MVFDENKLSKQNFYIQNGNGDESSTNIFPLTLMLQFCRKAQERIEFLAPHDLCNKTKVLAWVHDAYNKIHNDVVPDNFWQLINGNGNGPGVKTKKPTQPFSICGAKGGIAAMIYNLIMWSSFNQQCKAIIINCLESREKQISNSEHYPKKKEIWTWISALVISVQATVKYASKNLCLESKKYDWDSHDASIVKEPILIEVCYLTQAVASSFSPAFSSFIGMNSKINDCGCIDAISFVQMFVKHLGHVKPDVPIQKPLFQMTQLMKMNESKIFIHSFLAAQRKSYKIKFNSQQQKQQDNREFLQLKTQFSEMLQLKEIKALYKVVEKVKQQKIELEKVEATAEKALWSLGSNGMPKSKSDQNRFATCLPILTMFAYEFHAFLKGHKTNNTEKLKETGLGKKILFNFLKPAFTFVDANSSADRDKGIRERIKNALWVLVKGDPPLFSDLFIAEVLQGSFSIPTEDTWKHHFPFWFDTYTKNKVARSNVDVGKGKEIQTTSSNSKKRKVASMELKPKEYDGEDTNANIRVPMIFQKQSRAKEKETLGMRKKLQERKGRKDKKISTIENEKAVREKMQKREPPQQIKDGRSKAETGKGKKTLKKKGNNNAELKRGGKRAQSRVHTERGDNKTGAPTKKRQRIGVSLEGQKKPLSPDASPSAANDGKDIKRPRRSPRKKKVRDRN